MKAWAIDPPISGEYAELIPVYGDDEPAHKIICVECDDLAPWDTEVFEWEEGSDLIGDFVAALGRVVLQARVANEILKSFSGFKKGPVGMWEPTNLRRRRMSGRRTRVLLPYVGPKLCEMVVTSDVPLRPKSTVKIESECRACGRIQYKSFEGIAEKDMDATIPRKPGKGLFFAQKDLHGANFFRPKYTGFVLCTDLAKKFIEERQYSNVEFLEVGEILK